MKKALFISLCVLLLAGTGCKKNAEPEPHKVAVTGVSLKPNTLSLKVGKAEALSAVVIPANADNKTVSWSTSDPSVATVADGLVTAVKEGSATITVTTIDGGKTATCAVTVSTDTVPVTGITIDQGATAEVEEGKTITLTATVQPENATDKTVTWSSSNDAIATVANGAVTGVTPGEVVITAKAGDKTATCTVTVNSAIPAYEAVDLGLSVKWANKNLGAEFPEDAGDYYAWGETEPKQAFSWDNYKWYDGSAITKYNYEDKLPVLLAEDDVASAILGDKWRMPTKTEIDELIATKNNPNYQWTWKAENENKGWDVKYITGGGSIFIPAAGYKDLEKTYAKEIECHLWSMSLNADYPESAYLGLLTKEHQINSSGSRYSGIPVRPVYGELPHATSVKLNKSQATRYAGGVLQLKANVYPAQAINKSVTWSSSNEGVATVDANGRITVLAEGEAIITATTMDGGLTAQCKVTVNPTPEAAVFDVSAFNSSSEEEPILILKEGLSTATFTRKDGTIDFNGHSISVVNMQNNDSDKVVGLCNGIISQRLNGYYAWGHVGYHGKVMLEEMEVGKEFYTYGHIYIINSGYYECVDSYRTGSALGDVYIYGGHFKAFNHNPDAGSNQGDIYLFGGKFAMDPSSSYVNPTNPRANNNFIIGEGYSVKENTEEDKDEFPYIVSKD